MIGVLNDLWRYRVNDSTWTWMGGSNTTNQPGSYGTKGNASISNVPGSRYAATGWYDSLRQEFWLFGGNGFDSSNGMLLIVGFRTFEILLNT